MSLALCSRCARHCRTVETACPFCGARRLAIGAGVIAVATLAGCSVKQPASASHDAGATQAPITADWSAASSATSSTASSASSDAADAAPAPQQHERMAAPMYGLAPPPRQPKRPQQ